MTMDGALQQTIDTLDSAVARADVDGHDRSVALILRSALTLRRFTAVTEALARAFGDLSTRRDHPKAPKTLDSARRQRAHAYQVIARANADARLLEPHVASTVAWLAGAGDMATADEVKSACDAYLASAAALVAAADDVVDVMLVYEAELDPDNAEPPLSLEELEAKLDAAE